MIDFNAVLDKIAKSKMKSDYWLRFDLREMSVNPLPRRTQIVKNIYPEVSDIEIINTSCENVVSILNTHLKDKKDSSSIMANIYKNTSDVGNEYYELKTHEENHPTPGTFWNFWFLVINRRKSKALGLSGAASD